MINGKKSNKGFTLVELLVVIAIIAVLAAVVAPNAFQAIEKSKAAAVESDYRAFKTAVLGYYSDTGKWPTDIAVLDDASGIAGFNGPYIERIPKTPWGGDYIFWQNETSIGTLSDASCPYLKISTGTTIPSTSVNKLVADLTASVFNSTHLTFKLK